MDIRERVAEIVRFWFENDDGLQCDVEPTEIAARIHALYTDETKALREALERAKAAMGSAIDCVGDCCCEPDPPHVSIPKAFFEEIERAWDEAARALTTTTEGYMQSPVTRPILKFISVGGTMVDRPTGKYYQPVLVMPITDTELENFTEGGVVSLTVLPVDTRDGLQDRRKKQPMGYLSADRRSSTGRRVVNMGRSRRRGKKP